MFSIYCGNETYFFLCAQNCLIGVTTDRTGKKKYKAVVADLGLAEKIPTSPEDEKRLAIVGTAYIMAPEVLKGRPYNEKVRYAEGTLLTLAVFVLETTV